MAKRNTTTTGAGNTTTATAQGNGSTFKLTPWHVRVLGLVAAGHTTRKQLIMATGRGTGWAKCFGAHTKAMQGVQGPGLCGAGYCTHNPATNSYSLTKLGQQALAQHKAALAAASK